MFLEGTSARWVSGKGNGLKEPAGRTALRPIHGLTGEPTPGGSQIGRLRGVRDPAVTSRWLPAGNY